MKWTDEQQERFDDLRWRELVSTLPDEEQQELASLTRRLTQIADEALSPAISRLEREQAELEARLQQRQHDNEELAKRLLKQEQLMVESRRWLLNFDRRQAQIRETYTLLTGEVLA